MSTPGRSNGGRALRASSPSHGHSAGNASGFSTMASAESWVLAGPADSSSPGETKLLGMTKSIPAAVGQ
jgi:hypothetical protein